MPILPENLARYPKDWDTVVVPRIGRRSGGRCECAGQCGKHEGRCNAVNGNVGLWLKPGKFLPVLTERDATPDKVTHGEHHVPGLGLQKLVRIVLTVMHLDHTPENCDDANLLHGCQLCHNSYDAPHRRETRRARRAAADMFPEQH